MKLFNPWAQAIMPSKLQASDDYKGLEPDWTSYQTNSNTPQKTVWNGHTVDELYDAFQHAETGGESNQWIRTKVRPEAGSSAYGPVQTTKTLVDLYRKNEPQVLEPYQDLLKKFDKQATLFLNHGNNPQGQMGYSPIWDYGGTGFTWSDSEKQEYEDMNKAMMSHMMTYQPNMEKFIEGWRGEGRSDDDSYYERFDNFLNKP